MKEAPSPHLSPKNFYKIGKEVRMNRCARRFVKNSIFVDQRTPSLYILYDKKIKKGIYKPKEMWYNNIV